MKHAGPGIPHYGSDLVSHSRVETMDRTFGTSRLPLLEGAFLKALLGIDQELTTFRARSIILMLAVTVEIYHDCDGLAFPGYSGMFPVHCK